MSNIIMCDPKGGDPSALARAFLSNEVTEYIDDQITTLRAGAFSGCTNLKTVICHNVIAQDGNFISTSGIKKLALPNWQRGAAAVGKTGGFSYNNNTSLEVIDFGVGLHEISVSTFSGDTKLATIILRTPSVVKLMDVNAVSNTPFKSGGAGGTIYIPEALYDHLGDGTADDYKAATNWSTIDGYGTITWAKIDGSYYETHYGDDTPIST